ncbi:hypothetical protein D3C73_1445800 [compost metagenome]
MRVVFLVARYGILAAEDGKAAASEAFGPLSSEEQPDTITRAKAAAAAVNTRGLFIILPLLLC